MHLKTICNKILRTFSYNTTKHSKQGNKTMAKKPINPKDVYELMENDQGEIMLLLYAGETAPQKASFHLNEERKCIELYRNPKDTVIIEGLEKDSIIKLKQTKIKHTHAHMCTHINTQSFMHRHTHTHTQSLVHRHTETQSHIHKHTHTHHLVFIPGDC